MGISYVPGGPTGLTALDGQIHLGLNVVESELIWPVGESYQYQKDASKFDQPGIL
jgi:hypothetical protein